MCDDALCRMVLTIQGGLYLTPARSTQLLSLANNANPDDTCGPALGELSVRMGHGPAKAANIGSGGDEEPKLFTGLALMVSGTVTATSLERRMEYPLGHVDYVYDFKPLDAAALQQLVGSTDVESFPRVRPNSYSMKLVAKRKQATY